jgi:UDP-N-acetylglucosamine--N-acetylmuramyl-(pentapeptide) pyrophosphoryl-undecaprenol N-acetylglucosamine transferase
MDYAYAAADFIISRAGASSVSELCVVGKPVVFIPSPNVAEDHQTKNAQAISQNEAAILIEESKLEHEFETKFSKLLESETLQTKLKNNIQKLAKVSATEAIVNEVETLLGT